MKNLLIALTFSLALLSCEPETKIPLQGHWHSIKNAQPGVFHTLDINDTASILDMYTLSGMKFYPIPLKEGKDLILPTVYTFYSKDIQTHGDTVIIEKEFQYVRMEDCQYQEDLFSNLFVKIELPEDAGEVEFESLEGPFHTAFISVGKLKDGIVYKVASGDFVTSDEYFIQINDILPGPEYIHAFILTEFNASSDKSGLAIVLNVDKNVPEKVLQNIHEIMDHVEVPFTLFKTAWNTEKKRPSLIRL